MLNIFACARKIAGRENKVNASRGRLVRTPSPSDSAAAQTRPHGNQLISTKSLQTPERQMVRGMVVAGGVWDSRVQVALPSGSRE